MALGRFRETDKVHDVAKESGYSHRRFIAIFREAVGLSPKVYCRVQRFQKALTGVAAKTGASWVDLAIAAGYSDQSHFNREFREFAGVTPREYSTIAPLDLNHIRSSLFKTAEPSGP
ncbi:MAG: helix-turn-helix domain-containing protein [Bryobacteraceae bacterium]